MAVVQASTQRHVRCFLPPEIHRAARIAALNQGTAVQVWGTRLVERERQERRNAREETRHKTAD